MFKRGKANDAMESQGRTQVWLAQQLDVAPETINKYLSGKLDCPKVVAIAWATKLGLPENEFWDAEQQSTRQRRAG